MQGRQDHPVAWAPVHPLDLPLKNLDLTPEGENLGLQLGLIAMAGRQHIQEDAQ